jgi:hypothetical protein
VGQTQAQIASTFCDIKPKIPLIERLWLLKYAIDCYILLDGEGDDKFALGCDPGAGEEQCHTVQWTGLR